MASLRIEGASHAADVEDAPAALLRHVGEDGLREGEHASDVGADDGLEGGDGDLCHGAQLRDACVVHQHVNAAALLHHAVDRRLRYSGRGQGPRVQC